MTDFNLDAFLPYQLAVLSARVSAGFSRHYRKAYGISVAEWRVVAHLSRGDAVSVREIHERVDMDKPKVSRAASRLEEAGYITKTVNETDRRLVELKLTDKGRAMIDALAPIAKAYEQELVGALGGDDGPFRDQVRRLGEALKPRQTD
ncbi:MarR family winged helix-turn-helix transcriptional regulator [Aliiroseovarius subalbicans]|uniref:MarR family winged helix-turn-helix transcriptional regulator n=1 Tax=Aliiroseovarius subalbicans TaxID=2925840 RepID=UPI001F59A68E|nr:MarR family winged helix-turn-helix transcriptional regulator [uncultured Aliiroseovarius sp.]MCI2399434.1 MarR family winged helix-turn-helix transcriptional regulator [Aliiroseovarius subalbicans]